MRNQMTWNLLIIVQVDKVGSIFKFLSQEEKQKNAENFFDVKTYRETLTPKPKLIS